MVQCEKRKGDMRFFAWNVRSLYRAGSLTAAARELARYKWILRKWGVGLWVGSRWQRIGTGGGPCECGSEPSGYIKCGEFLD